MSNAPFLGEKILGKNKKLEKKLSDAGRDYKIDTRKWRIGDIVRVREYDITGLPSHSRGMIVSSGDDEQMKIFPWFNVYIFGDAYVRDVWGYNLEIISAA
tara:strand:+ start:471 stop:770 length:300 start_codon:yes stop_codon:yes gene_type:complete